jgi:hypothetical protein
LKKRTKKLLRLCAGAGERSATANKSFLLLFFKREGLPLSLDVSILSETGPAIVGRTGLRISAQIESIEVHNFRPCSNKVMHERKLRILAPEHFGDSPQL